MSALNVDLEMEWWADIGDGIVFIRDSQDRAVCRVLEESPEADSTLIASAPKLQGRLVAALSRGLEVLSTLSNVETLRDELLAACKEMRARLNTVPINYVIPSLCEGDLARWDAIIGKNESNQGDSRFTPRT